MPRSAISFQALRRPRRLVAFAAVALALAGCASGRPLDPAAPASIEALFAEAYFRESGGSEAEALRDYSRLAGRHPGSPLAAVARQRADGLTVRGIKAPAVSYAVGDAVCSASDLYPNRAGWCGKLRRSRGAYHEIEVSDLRFGTFWTLGFGRSVCTGDKFLSWFDAGARIWVPETCLAEPVIL